MDSASTGASSPEAEDASAALPVPAAKPSPPMHVQDLGQLLVARGLLTDDRMAAASRYAEEHRLNLLQAILELNLVPADQLQALSLEPFPPAPLVEQGASNGDAEGLPAPIAAAPAPVPPAPSLPDRAQLERNIRNELREIALTATPSDLVDQIVRRGFDSRATDIHFDPQQGHYRVRFRIDGQLHDLLELEGALSTAVISRMKVMANLNIVERRHAQDGRLTVVYGDRPRDLRISTLPALLGEKIVVRIHEALTEAFGFDQLGLSPAQADQLSGLIRKPYGAVLVGGPVGAGKTTTLYSCLDRVNLPTRNVMTIEDPIEYRLAGVNQIQVDHRTGLTFGEGLRSILRQDPDVLMIGEIRDEETAQIGIRAALTGVLVFSTVHASDAASTIGSLYNFGIAGYLLSTSLQGLVSQRLVRRICPYCRVSYPADPSVLEALDVEPREPEGLMLSHGEGCRACFGTGYLGRTGVFEIMDLGEELRELVLRQTPKEVLRQAAIDLGMQTLKQSAVDKVLEGTTTVEEVHRVVAI